MPRRTIVRIISYGFAVALALTGAAMYNRQLAIKYQMQLEYTYQRALEELTSNLNNIDMTLEKGIYAGSALQLSTISAKLWRESGSAKAALAQLPASNEELATINKFLSQVGDYSLALSKKAIAGSPITQEERDALLALSSAASNLARQISDIRALYEEGKLWRGEVQNVLKKNLPENGDVDSFGSSLTEVEDTMTDYPTLIYDGPFSDHFLQQQPEMLKDKPEINREEARAIAAKFIGVPASQLADDSDEEGTMPSYCFIYNNQTYISVTKQGGFVTYMRNAREIGDQTLSYEQAIEKASQFLSDKIGETFKESYYLADEGVCVINFSYKDGATVCYTDLIKVGVALDNGEIVFYEPRGYLMNHKPRTIATPKYTVEEAQRVLSDSLTVQSYQLALIPSGGNYEIHCYEFACKGLKDEDILVYVNTQTLVEEQILILLKTDGGILAK